MLEIKKKKIVIASVLKPVDDSRMAEKIGVTLADTGLFDVHIFGYPAKSPQPVALMLHQSLAFPRLSFSRVLQPFRLLHDMVRLKPEMLIVTTHELLGIALVVKMLCKSLIIYDVQEDYYQNIRFTAAFPMAFKPFLAAYVRLKEHITAPFIDLFLLAEKIFAEELHFVKNKHVIIENKVKLPRELSVRTSAEKKEKIELLFSGTLAETTGVFNAIALAKSLHVLNSKIRLTLIGHCPQQHILRRIMDEIKAIDFILLIGGQELVPHTSIIRAIQQSDFGIVAYTPNRSTEKRIPTKLYEYLGHRLPILLTDNPRWIAYCLPFSAAISVDYKQPDASFILDQMNIRHFYTAVPTEIYWEGEAKRLIERLTALRT
jgi:hypothetical protein